MSEPKMRELHIKTVKIFFNQTDIDCLLANEAARRAGLPNPVSGSRRNRPDGEPVADIRIERTTDSTGYPTGYRAFVEITQTFIDRETPVSAREEADTANSLED